MKEMVCIRCPIGCRLKMEQKDGDFHITGNRCPKGIAYAKEELTCPMRIVTCLVRVEGSPIPLSVKTEKPIPKEKIFPCIAQIKALQLKAPIAIGTVVLENAADTGVCVVATKSV